LTWPRYYAFKTEEASCFLSKLFSVCPAPQIGVVHSSESVEHANHMAVQSQYMRPVHHPLVVHTADSDHISGKVSPDAS